MSSSNQANDDRIAELASKVTTLLQFAALMVDDVTTPITVTLVNNHASYA